MIYIDIRQMEIHRYATGEQDWSDAERNEYGRKIDIQTRYSILSLLLSIACLTYLIIKIAQ